MENKPQKGINFWMIISFILAGALFFVLGTFFPNLIKEKKEIVLSPTQTMISPTASLLVTPITSPSVSISPTVSEASMIDQIKQAFAKKYNKPVADVEANVSKSDSTHAWGSVKFAGEVSGGWFLAYKGTDGWMIVQDGNGTISCEVVAPYNFPKSMVPECVDKNGNLVK